MPGHYIEKTFLFLINVQLKYPMNIASDGPYHGHSDIMIFHIQYVYIKEYYIYIYVYTC